MLKKAHHTHSLVSLIIFTVLFVISITLYLSWRGMYISVYQNDYELIAALYLLPLNCILGTVIVLYCFELLGILKITRLKAMRIVLLIALSLIILWLVLLITSVHGQIFGKGIQSFISTFSGLFPIQLSLYFHDHINDVLGMIIYEIIGIGLFASIGSKAYTNQCI